MAHHEVKSWKQFFQPIKAGQKLHDLRYDADRNFAIGDIITLREYDMEKGEYTGETCGVEVTYITSSKTPCAFSSAVLSKDYCILSLKLLG
jgi:uncharacterized protein YqfB (UPF0267 family)